MKHVEQIADRFVAKLVMDLPPAEFAKMQALNKAETNPQICHSHDFCDANMPMAEAFEEIVGREIDLQSDADTALWSAAWDYAMSHGLGK